MIIFTLGQFFLATGTLMVRSTILGRTRTFGRLLQVVAMLGDGT